MKNKFIFLFIILCLFSSNVYADEFCEMSDEYKAYLELSDEEKAKVEIPSYCAANYSSNKETLCLNSRAKDYASATQTSYNAYTEGLVTSVKNQYYTGSCWTFSATSLVESLAIIANYGKFDFSERHMEYSSTRAFANGGINKNGYNRNLDDGGNGYMASSYYYRGDGPILESSMPFKTTNEQIDISAMPSDKSAVLLDDFIYYTFDDTVCSESKIKQIKENVIKYGSVSISIYADDSYLTNGFYYYNGSSNILTNHAVTIVGWDDSISKSNFKTTATMDGAFIVKNSWGTNWGNGGFFYLSYSDVKACGRFYNYTGVVKNDYDNVYNSSEVLSNSGYGYSNISTLYYASKFTKKTSNYEVLDRVSLDVYSGYTYQVYYSSDSNLSNSSSWKSIGNFTSIADGVKTITFDPIAISSSYSIIVKMISSTSSVYVPIMCKTTSSSDEYYYFDIDTGKNYISTNASSWNDISSLSNTYFSGCENVIYAYTKNSSTVTNVEFSLGSLTSSSSIVYTGSDDYFEIPVTSKNVDNYGLFISSILDENGKDVTSLFTITGSVKDGLFKIALTDDTVMGSYTFSLNYLGNIKTINFEVYSLIESSEYDIDDFKVYIDLNEAKELSKETFLSKIKSSYTIVIYDKNGNDVTSSTSYIGTGMRVKVDSYYYDIVVNGDINGDGKIQSNDALIISRYLVSLVTLNDLQLKAADVSGDNRILSNDSLLISRFLVGIKSSL